MSGRFSLRSLGVCPGMLGGSPPTAKLGRFTTPPRMATPAMAVCPPPVPAPPWPGAGEIPPLAFSRAPKPVPVSEAPEPSPTLPLPPPLPLPKPAPLPSPPRPGRPPPVRDMARAPPAALPGIPTFSPGCMDITTPEPLGLPPLGPITGAGRSEASSLLPPFPPPGRPLPATTGGGGTTPGPPVNPRASPAAKGLPSEKPAVGCTGGGTTFLVPPPKNDPAALQISFASVLVLGAGCTGVGGGKVSLGLKLLSCTSRAETGGGT